MKHYKVLKRSHGDWKNLQRPQGHAHEVGDIILANDKDGTRNCKYKAWKEATKAEIEKAQKGS